MTVLPITPQMPLAPIGELLAVSDSEAAFVLLELIAEGHWAKDFHSLPETELEHALARAFQRMDKQGLRV